MKEQRKFAVGDRVIVINPLTDGFHGGDGENLRGREAVILGMYRESEGLGMYRESEGENRYWVLGDPPVGERAFIEHEIGPYMPTYFKIKEVLR